MLEYDAVCCSVMQCVYQRGRGLLAALIPALYGISLLQCVGVCWSVLECVAVYCRVLQCVAEGVSASCDLLQRWLFAALLPA